MAKKPTRELAKKIAVYLNVTPKSVEAALGMLDDPFAITMWKDLLSTCMSWKEVWDHFEEMPAGLDAEHLFYARCEQLITTMEESLQYYEVITQIVDPAKAALEECLRRATTLDDLRKLAEATYRRNDSWREVVRKIADLMP